MIAVLVFFFFFYWYRASLNATFVFLYSSPISGTYQRFALNKYFIIIIITWLGLTAGPHETTGIILWPAQALTIVVF